MKNNVEDLKKRQKNLRTLKKIMVFLDILILPIIMLEIMYKNFNVPSFIILIVCNLIVFFTRIKEK